MSYRTVLVCLNEIERAAILLQLAGDLAQSQDPDLAALFVIPGLRIYPANGVAITSEIVEAHQEIFKSRCNKAKAVFDSLNQRPAEVHSRIPSLLRMHSQPIRGPCRDEKEHEVPSLPDHRPSPGHFRFSLFSSSPWQIKPRRREPPQL
jgi:hypothetical protein